MSEDAPEQVLKFVKPTDEEYVRLKQKHRDRNACKHFTTTIDFENRRIACDDCGIDVDPFNVINNIMEYDRGIELRIEQLNRLLYESNERTRIKQATCKHQRMMPFSDGGGYCASCELRINPKAGDQPCQQV